MFSKFMAFILLISGLYLVGVFILPDMADQYGNSLLNAKIRDIKNKSLEYTSGSESPTSLADKLMNTGKNIIDETKKTTEHIQSTVTQKSEQTKEVINSIHQIYDATQDAKKDLEDLINFSGITQKTTSGTIR